MTKDEALRLALEAFNNLAAWNDGEVGSHMDEPYSAEVAREAITAIKEALAQTEQESVVIPDCGEAGHADGACGNRECLPSFRRNTTPPQRTWVGLTNDEVNNFAAGCHLGNSVQGAIYKAEAKLKEKNT